MTYGNLEYAPKPNLVDGFNAVPIDIQTINAVLNFDAATSVATGDATITYKTGLTDGYSVFDLRQTITAAWLDGVSVLPANLTHHDFGGGSNAEMRIINSFQNAGTIHNLRVQYNIDLPQTDTGGSYPPHVLWSAGPRLIFNFGFTDLRASRYLESFIPCNLIYDQFQLDLEIQLLNTAINHSVITNGTVTDIGPNHWSVNFPPGFTALSVLFELRATDTLTNSADTVTLPVSGNIVTVEAWKLNTDAITNLTNEINDIKTFLTDNENEIGSYIHGNRFTAFFIAGGMEYEGGTTATTGSIEHETYHSWWARGVKPARPQDGWWDEAWDSYHDAGGSGITPFNFANPPIQLCSQNEWQRITDSDAYTAGEMFWEGMASLLGVANLKSLMKDFYSEYKGKIAATYDFESFFLCKTGNTQIVNAFHRFVYGFDMPSPLPDLWLKDEITDPGLNYWGGRFWDSPDLWVRNTDDDETTHQNPEYGQDNWIYARIRNKSVSTVAQHFVVAFNVKTFAGTQFVYPSDFLPCVAAATGFNLAPSQDMIVKAKWPGNLVPPQGTHACLVASILTPGDFPAPGIHVWEHNNLAQKNLTIVDLQANDYIIVPFVTAHYASRIKGEYYLQAVPHNKSITAAISLISNAGLPEKINTNCKYENFLEGFAECGLKNTTKAEPSSFIRSTESLQFKKIFPRPYEQYFTIDNSNKIIITMAPTIQHVYALKIQVPHEAIKGEIIKFDLLQKHTMSNKITGGIAVEIHVY